MAVNYEKNEDKVVEFGWTMEDLETMLINSTLWIADPGATINSTSNKIWVKNRKEVQDDMIVVMRNGQNESVTKSSTATCGWAIMKAANIPVDHRTLFWREAFQTST